MSKAKDIRRAQGQPFKSTHTGPRMVCPFPGCGREFYHEEGRIDVCAEHTQFISDYIFCMEHVHRKDQIPPAEGKIVIPKPGQSIQDAAKGAKT